VSSRAAPAGASRLRALIERSGATATPAGAPASAEAAEHCGLCGLPIPDAHRHVLDLTRRELHCACRACSILFDHAAAGGQHYRLIPERCERVAGLTLGELEWRSLGIPVQMAFFVRDGERNRVTAYYPSPAGATASTLEFETWDEIEARNPGLAEIAPDVEALLVDRTGDKLRAFIVGLDQCYRLIAVVRTHWRGFTGGERVWQEIERFFAALDARAGAPA
jgi:hypothetical protein